MFSRPDDLADREVALALAGGWRLSDVEVQYAPVGFGSHHWQVRSGPDRWFATVDDLEARRLDEAEPSAVTRARLVTALTGARQLQQRGLDFVVAPLPDAAGRLVRDLGDRYVLALYPFVDGQTRGWGEYPDRAAREQVVRRLAALHTVDRDGTQNPATDDFSLPQLGSLHLAVDDLGREWRTGPYGEGARGLLARHRNALLDALERYRAQVAAVATGGAARVPTHGEPHPGNTIDTPAGVVLIDWDTLLLAPAERDLWGLQDEDPAVLDLYRSLTGRPVDPDLLALYRLRWDLSEVCLYATQFHRRHEQSDDTAEAWQGLQHHLDPTRW